MKKFDFQKQLEVYELRKHRETLNIEIQSIFNSFVEKNPERKKEVKKIYKTLKEIPPHGQWYVHENGLKIHMGPRGLLFISLFEGDIEHWSCSIDEHYRVKEYDIKNHSYVTHFKDTKSLKWFLRGLFV